MEINVLNELKVKLENFEGPMDLLLHLVEKEKLNICEINISKIIDEYLYYIKTAINNNLELKVEFLVIATELLEIKSLAVLNRKEKKEKEEILEQKLMEYKRYKEIAEEMEKIENEFRISYAKGGKEIKKEISPEIDLTNVTLDRIFEEYKAILQKNVNIDIKLDLEVKYSMEEGMEEVNNILFKYKREAALESIFENNLNKYKIVVIFLAILEMYKMDKIDFIQGEKMYIRLK